MSAATPSTVMTMMFLGAMLFALWMVAAMLLRMSCMLNSVPRPRMVGASVLVLVVAGASVAMHAALSIGMGMTTQGLGLEHEYGRRLLVMLGVPVHMLVAGTAYRMLLPTTFGRAISVWIVQMLGMALVAAMLGMTLSRLAPDLWASLHATLGM